MRLPVAAPAFLALGLGFAAQAKPVPPGEEGELLMFLPPSPGEHACFRHAWDAAHLAARPDQTVTDMEFRIAYFRLEADDNTPAGQRNYYFTLLAKRRGDAERLSALGICASLGPGKSIGCNVFDDGGGVSVSKGEDGAVLVDLGENGRIRLMADNGDAGPASFDLFSGRDDRAFKLEPVPAAQCPAYDDW